MKILFIMILMLITILSETGFAQERECFILIDSKGFDGSLWGEEVLDTRIIAKDLSAFGFKVIFERAEFESLLISINGKSSHALNLMKTLLTCKECDRVGS